MRKQLLAMASAAVLGLAGAASAPLSAGAIQLAPDLGTQANSNIIQVQGPGRDGDGARKTINRSGGPGQSGASRSSRGDKAISQRGVAGPNRQVQGRTVQQQKVQRQNVQRQDFSSRRSVERSPRVNVQRRIVRQGWSRDRRHAFYGAYLLGIPYGYAAYASNPCYDWVAGPQGPGYYWNYGRCPV